MKLNKKTIIDIAIMILIAIVAIFFIWNVLKDSGSQTKTRESQNSLNNAVDQEVQKLIPEVSKVTEEGQVVTSEGKPVKNDAIPGSDEAPKQSAPIKDIKQLPTQVTKLIITEKGFAPLSFEVKSKQVVNLAISSGDSHLHVFKFEDPSLSAVNFGVSSGETRVIVFNAPEKPGEYKFFCDVPGHQNRGEQGTMIVK
ncbi:MAG: cupredoxin domain-containing protein [Candidatus Kuenenbacteria bacterium]